MLGTEKRPNKKQINYTLPAAQTARVFLIGDVGVTSLGRIMAIFIPDLPLVPDKVKPLPLGRTRPRLLPKK